jgi:gamma-glutamyltranspeptidase/glutathione hydrolase/leukotriene-C4 hydrolase
MLIRSPNGTYDFIDFRETAPAAAHKDMYVDDPSKAQVGGLAVGVPYVDTLYFAILNSLIIF